MQGTTLRQGNLLDQRRRTTRLTARLDGIVSDRYRRRPDQQGRFGKSQIREARRQKLEMSCDVPGLPTIFPFHVFTLLETELTAIAPFLLLLQVSR
jgi:hypothetical protein